MDFVRIRTKEGRKETDPIEVYPEYVVDRSKDLMVQGKAFYAVWDETKGLWSRDEYDVALLVDYLLSQKVEELKASGVECVPKFLRDYDTGRWDKFQKFVKSVSDNSHPLDMKITFANTEVKKKDYASRRLPYSMGPGDITAYDTIISRLYSPEERQKIEWAIGAIISGDAKKIEKFIVFYGRGGTGKSTIMKIITMLFGGKVKDGGYVAMFDAQALVGSANQFATEAFKDNPLVAIQHDGDLSRIEDNSRLNSIVSHEEMRINEKYKATYDHKINAFLFMGTNKPVQITDSKSGMIRRLIDVNPTGDLFEVEEYRALMSRVPFELGAIAHHCLQVYKKNKNAYEGYEPTSMMLKTNVFYNFIEDHFDVFKEQDGTTLDIAWTMYRAYSEDSKLKFTTTKQRFREELKDYFEEFHTRKTFGGALCRSVYIGFKPAKYKAPLAKRGKKAKIHSLVLEETVSLLDEMYAGLPAQYGNSEENPRLYWDDSERYDKNGNLFTPREDQIVNTVLGDLDTSRLHFLKVPEHHIVIDFDLKDENGNKSLELNKEAASSWPPTYAELSKSGNGVHLHYIWDGDPSELAAEYSDGIEIKVYSGNSSLRRRLSLCNNVAVATIASGLPFREKKPMLQNNTLRSEKNLRALIMKALMKEIHNATKPSVDFIEHILREAHRSGMVYDVTDMRPKIMAFANNSSNQAAQCLRAVARMEFKSEVSNEDVPDTFKSESALERDNRVVFFDCEVYPNLFVVCWKFHGSPTVMRMINPSAAEMVELSKMKLVGFNNRGYDNHIIYARILGASNAELYNLSQKIIVEKDENAKFGAAWNLSYADVYDFSVDKKTLKKWEIELGIPHVEMDIPWDEPVPENKIKQVVDYCCNDVNALEAVWDHCEADFQARQILANMSGLNVNNSTRQHAIRIMFGDEKNPQKDFVYTDLSEEFPGYKFDPYNKVDKSTYDGEVVGEGGYVYAEPGIHTNVALLDIASMHPSTIIRLNLFGKYTKKFAELVEARLAIKHGDFKRAGELLPGVQVTKLNASALSEALKLVINSIYGYTAAKFDNPFRDKRNIDNIVAKRGALFMVKLKRALQAMGVTVAHIKTDSVKIPNATPEVIKFVTEFGAEYGYVFEHEATYEKMCLVNDAVYIAKVGWTQKKGKVDFWSATGAQFQHPYVFKALFTHEPISFNDLCETKQVKKGAMYLKFNGVQKEIGDHKEGALTFDRLVEMVENDDADPETTDTHIGRSGMFVPINPDQDIFKGGDLVCLRDGKESAVAGTKGFKWAEAEMIRTLQDGAIERMIFERVEDAVEGTGSIADVVDMTYYEGLANEAINTIDKFGDFDDFVNDDYTALSEAA